MQDNNLYLIYNSESKAILDNLLIQSNIATYRGIERGGTVWNKYIDLEQLLSDLQGNIILPEQFPILGKKLGVEVKNEGYTTAWAMVRERDDLAGEWFIPKPLDIIIDGQYGFVIDNYVRIETYNQSWINQSDV